MTAKMTIAQLAQTHGYELRHFSVPLAKDEDENLVVRPFDFSSQHGGTLNAPRFYNNFYLYPITATTGK